MNTTAPSLQTFFFFPYYFSLLSIVLERRKMRLYSLYLYLYIEGSGVAAAVEAPEAAASTWVSTRGMSSLKYPSSSFMQSKNEQSDADAKAVAPSPSHHHHHQLQQLLHKLLLLYIQVL